MDHVSVEILPSRPLDAFETLKADHEKLDGVKWYIRYNGKICPLVGETREQAIMMAIGAQWAERKIFLQSSVRNPNGEENDT